MSDEEINFMRLDKCEKKAVIPALKETHKILWDRQYPAFPWTWTEEDVKRFEKKEEEAFQVRIRIKPNNERKKKTFKHDNRNTNVRGKAESEQRKLWRSGDWDVGKLVHVLVDSRLFQLETISVGLSTSITKLREIRNRMSHYTAYAVNTTVFEQNAQEIIEGIEGLQCILRDYEKYVEVVEDIKKEEKPVFDDEKEKMIKEYELIVHEKQMIRYELQLSEATNEILFYKNQIKELQIKQEENLQNKSRECQLLSDKNSTLEKENRELHSKQEEIKKLTEDLKNKSRECQLLSDRNSTLEKEKQCLTEKVAELNAEKETRSTKQILEKLKVIEKMIELQHRPEVEKSKPANLRNKVDNLQNLLQEKEKLDPVVGPKGKEHKLINLRQLQDHDSIFNTLLSSVYDVQKHSFVQKKVEEYAKQIDQINACMKISMLANRSDVKYPESAQKKGRNEMTNHDLKNRSSEVHDICLASSPFKDEPDDNVKQSKEISEQAKLFSPALDVGIFAAKAIPAQSSPIPASPKTSFAQSFMQDKFKLEEREKEKKKENEKEQERIPYFFQNNLDEGEQDRHEDSDDDLFN